MEPRFFGRAASALNHLAISPGPRVTFKKESWEPMRKQSTWWCCCQRLETWVQFPEPTCWMERTNSTSCSLFSMNHDWCTLTEVTHTYMHTYIVILITFCVWEGHTHTHTTVIVWWSDHSQQKLTLFFHVWVLGSNLDCQAWWQKPLPAEPSQ